MKRALTARDKHCRFPGYDMPPAWTDGHRSSGQCASHSGGPLDLVISGQLVRVGTAVD